MVHLLMVTFIFLMFCSIIPGIKTYEIHTIMKFNDGDNFCNFEYLPDINQMIFWVDSPFYGLMFKHGDTKPSFSNFTDYYYLYYSCDAFREKQYSQIDKEKKEVIVVTPTGGDDRLIYKKKIGKTEFQLVGEMEKSYSFSGPQPFTANNGKISYMIMSDSDQVYIVLIQDTESGEKKRICSFSEEELSLLGRDVVFYKDNYYFITFEAFTQYNPRTGELKELFNETSSEYFYGLVELNGLLYFSNYIGYEFDGEEIKKEEIPVSTGLISKDEKALYNLDESNEIYVLDVYDVETKTKTNTVKFSKKGEYTFLTGEDEKNNLIVRTMKDSTHFFSYNKDTNKKKNLGKVSYPGVPDEEIFVQESALACGGKAVGVMMISENNKYSKYLFVADGNDKVVIVEQVCEDNNYCRTGLNEIYCSKGFLYYVNYMKNVINTIDLN